MTTQITASFSIASWDEKTWDAKPATEVTGDKLTRAEVTYRYQGAMVGEGKVQYLMAYNGDGTGSFVALEQYTGSVDGRSGSFVFQHIGTFSGEAVNGTLTVVPGSGQEELEGLRGEATIALAGHQESYPIPFTYELP